MATMRLPVDSELLTQFLPLESIVCSPLDGSPLRLISASELLARLPAAECSRVSDEVVGAFVSESALVAYPIVGCIVDFLEQDALRLSEDRLYRYADEDEHSKIKASVTRWYDAFGWKRNEDGIYGDTGMFSQLSLSGHGLYELASHLSVLDRLSGGEFILDAASGAIAHPEYFAYSWFYKHRVCVDMSRTALQEAASKLGAGGLYCLADICRLPFRENAFDAVVSGYTLQHIPEAQQQQAVRELCRVTKPGSHVCVMSVIQPSLAHRALVKGARAVARFLGLRRPDDMREVCSRDGGPVVPPHRLYSVVRNFRWWRDTASGLTEKFRLEGLRLFDKDEFEDIFGNSARAAKIVRALESLFPSTAAKFCAYLLVDLEKLVRPEV